MNRSLFLSVLLHVIALSLLWADFSFMRKEIEPTTSVPLIIDLKNIIVAEKTNLPPAIKKTTPKPKPASKPQSVQAKSTPKPTTPKPIETKPLKEAVQATEKKTEPEKQMQKVQKPTQQKVSKPTAEDNLKSLLASVDKIKKPLNTPTPLPETEQALTEGIKGGTEGSLTQPLSISERDLIAAKLRSCWNVDAGKSGIEEMIVEIKVLVNKEGRVLDVQTLNMRNDPIFRSVAESAQRAVYICDNKGSESPFQILAEKYKSNYNSWKEIYVRFNPIDGGVY